MITYRGERFSGYNRPKRTPGKSKKFAVLAKQGSRVKLIRFGDPNKKGYGKNMGKKKPTKKRKMRKRK